MGIKWKAYIQYKNDEQQEGALRVAWETALLDLREMLSDLETGEGNNGTLEDVQIAQIEPVTVDD